MKKQQYVLKLRFPSGREGYFRKGVKPVPSTRSRALATKYTLSEIRERAKLTIWMRDFPVWIAEPVMTWEPVFSDSPS